jgi:hypothetical protein
VDTSGGGQRFTGASVGGAEEDVAHANPGLRTVVEEPPLLVKEGLGTGVPNSLLEVEAPPPHQADTSSAGRTNEEMVQEERSPRRRPRLSVVRRAGPSWRA